MPHSTFQESLLQGLHELSRLDSWIRLLGMAPSAGIMGPDLKMASLGPMGQRGAGPPGEIAQNVLEPVANGQIGKHVGKLARKQKWIIAAWHPAFVSKQLSFKMFWPLKGWWTKAPNMFETYRNV